MTCQALAKVNLTLEVLGLRPDGYHALRSIVLPVSLCDTLDIASAETLTCDTGYADDLGLKAARLLDAQRGAALRVTKRIPVGGGLGGGSADAAAALHALNALWGLGKTCDELVALAAHVGSDVPALTHGGVVIMEGRGECVTPLPIQNMPHLHLVLANPCVHCATKDVYARCTARNAETPNATQAMIAALESGDLSRIAQALTNDLQAPAIALHPEIGAALDAVRAAGAVGALMSGSGSTVFGLAESAAHAQDLATRLARQGLDTWAVESMEHFKH